MVRASLVLLLLASAAVADVWEDNFESFFKEEISGRFHSEELSQQRLVMIRGFAKHDTPSAAKWLVAEVIAKDPAADVVRQAVRVLSKYKRNPTVEAYAAAYRKLPKRGWEARALGLTPCAKLRHDATTALLAETFKFMKDERILVAACRATGAGGHRTLRSTLERQLKHKHPAVRGAALIGLGALGGEESLPLVFNKFCSDKSNRVRYDAWRALGKLTLEELKCDPGAWTEWWEKMQATHAGEGKNPWGEKFPRLPREYAVPGYFFKIPVMGDRVCFVLDTSGSMEQPWRVNIKAQRKQIPNIFSVKTRWDLARAFVADCLKKLPPTTELAFVFYNSKLQRFPDKGRFAKNSVKTRDRIKKFMEEAHRGGSTAIFDGFEAGWGFIKDGHPKQNFMKGCDTIVFLTDGDPADGKYENEPERIRDEIWRIAMPRGLRIHTVGLHNHSFDLVRCIAADCDGLYVHGQQWEDPAEPQDLDFWPAKRKEWEKTTKKRWKPKSCDAD